MKYLAIFSSVLFSICAAVNTTSISFDDDFQATNYPGDEYRLHWSVDRAYTLELLLVEQKHDGWDDPAQILFKGYTMQPGEEYYNWTVPEVNGIFCLYLHGKAPEDNQIHYTNQTLWFQINGPKPLSPVAVGGVATGAAVVAILVTVAVGLVFWRKRRQAAPCHNCAEIHPVWNESREVVQIAKPSFETTDSETTRVVEPEMRPGRSS